MPAPDVRCYEVCHIHPIQEHTEDGVRKRVPFQGDGTIEVAAVQGPQHTTIYWRWVHQLSKEGFPPPRPG